MTPRRVGATYSIILLLWSVVALTDDRKVIEDYNQIERALKNEEPTCSDTLEAGGEFLLSKCEFLKRRSDYPFLKERWAADASGIDLLQSEKILEGAKYDHFKIAVVEEGDGTHRASVGSLISSTELGIDPNLRLVQLDVDQVSWKTAFERIIDDPDIKIINISNMLAPKPELMALARKALSQGKWIVYAAGNQFSQMSPDTKTISKLRPDKRFFSASGLFFFGAPQFVFGTDADYFSPVTFLEAFTGNAEKSFGGTSAAAPQQSAVLAAMRAIYPQLTAELARKILDKTAIRRGSSPSVRQMNPYHAISLLKRAVSCLGSGKEVPCIDKRDADLQREALAAIPLNVPDMKSCGAWKSHYEQIRKAYFLTNAGPKSVARLRDFFKTLEEPLWAENFYFSGTNPRGAIGSFPAQNYPRIDGDGMDSVYNVWEKAVRFFGGKANAISNGSLPASKMQTAQDYDAYLFGQLLPVKANANAFAEVCFYKKDIAGANLCLQYLASAPRSFQDAVIDGLIARKKPIVECRSCVLSAAQNPDREPIAPQVFDKLRALGATDSSGK